MKLTFLRYGVKILIGLSFTIHSCGLMKKTEKTTEYSSAMLDSSSHTKSISSQENNTNSLRMVFKKEDVQLAYQVQLWPKGKFTFSAEHGFEGEAERIVISGEAQQNTNLAELSTMQLQNKEQQQSEKQERKTQKEIEKKEIKSISTDFRWVIGGVVLLILVGIWLYRRLVST